MARIYTNISSTIAQNNLRKSNADLSVSLERLSTGLRINRGADDPAGLIVSERLRSEMKGLNQAIDNSERASSVIATTEGYLAEVADLLNSVKNLVVQAANTGGVSKEEIEANQLQVDSAIESITRISSVASFAGLDLLNGSLEYTTSGLDNTDIAFSRIDSARFGTATSLDVDVEVTTPAEKGLLWLSSDAGGFTGFALDNELTLEIAGKDGAQTLTFAAGTQQSAMVNAINLISDSTGVEAAFLNSAGSSGIQFRSEGYGTESFVSVRPVGSGGSGFEAYTAPGGSAAQRDEGVDVKAIVNGALATGRGLSVSMNTPALSMELDLAEAFGIATTPPANQSNFQITGGGANFQLGPSVNSAQQISLGIGSVAASRLGGSLDDTGSRFFLNSLKSGQDNELATGDSALASDILDKAILEVSKMRGRLGAFERNTIQTNVRSLQIGLENITASESKIRDADFAAETANLTRAQILNQAGTSVLATANSSAQNVLALLQ
ncbi:MAG: flagellin [Phycisphaerales bacterium]|jgi:flagellin|nr:flagellin [Phycisphaerales bacterium]